MPRSLCPEMALDDDQRDAFAGHLDRMGVVELVRREAAPHPGSGGGAPQLGAGRGRRPVAPARRTAEDAQQRTDRKLAPQLEPGLEPFPAQASMPTSRRRPPLPRGTSKEPRR